MNNFKSIALALVLVLASATAKAQTKNIDVSKSSINWVGKKVTGKHEGTVALKDGTLEFKSKKLVGGNFTVAMNSLLVTDLQSGQGKEKLEGHLKSDDFFGTENFPIASLVFTSTTLKSGNTYTVIGDLTIKGKTNPISFEITTTANGATANLKIDRTKYAIKYGSGSFFDNLGDKAINDTFDLVVALKF